MPTVYQEALDGGDASSETPAPDGIPENTAGAALPERAGFRRAGTRERIGRHRGRWRDVLLRERRSTLVG